MSQRSTLLRPALFGLAGAGAVVLGLAFWAGLLPHHDAAPLEAADTPQLVAPPQNVAAAAPAPAPPPAVAPAPVAPAAASQAAAPSAPAVAATAPPAAAPPPAAPSPSFDVVRVAPGGSAVLAGRSTPGADVAIADNGREIGRTHADAAGQWVVLPTAPLTPGGQELTVTATESSGQKTQGSAPVLVLVPQARAATATNAPAAPPPAAVAILTPPNAAPRLLQETSPDKARLGLDIVDYTDHGAIRFTGRAPPGATVRLYIDGNAAGDVTADAQGQWSLLPNQDVAAGNHELRLDQLVTGGQQVASRIALPFQRAPVAEQAVAGGRVVVQPSESLWRIAKQAYGSGVQYMTIYQANRGQIGNPNLIYPGQIFTVPGPKGG